MWYWPPRLHTYKGISKSFRTGHLEREMQLVQLSATRCSCIVSQSSEFCRHNPLRCFSTSNTKGRGICRYRLRPVAFGYTLVVEWFIMRWFYVRVPIRIHGVELRHLEIFTFAFHNSMGEIFCRHKLFKGKPIPWYKTIPLRKYHVFYKFLIIIISEGPLKLL